MGKIFGWHFLDSLKMLKEITNQMQTNLYIEILMKVLLYLILEKILDNVLRLDG